MTTYYGIGHNTAYNRGMPEIYEIVAGIAEHGKCSTCGADRRVPSGDLGVRLGKTLAKMWPDVIACGDYPCFVVSELFVNAMKGCGVRLILGGKVSFFKPIENGLSLENAPEYFWVDGSRHRAARMDFGASGFVDVHFCPECGRRTDNVSLTYDRRHATPPPPYVFDCDSPSGFDLFTTDLAPTAFFCTERVVMCARENRLTNIGFLPVDQGVLAKPLDI